MEAYSSARVTMLKATLAQPEGAMGYCDLCYYNIISPEKQHFAVEESTCNVHDGREFSC
jgi:hypothetical protein